MNYDRPPGPLPENCGGMAGGDKGDSPLGAIRPAFDVSNISELTSPPSSNSILTRQCPQRSVAKADNKAWANCCDSCLKTGNALAEDGVGIPIVKWSNTVCSARGFVVEPAADIVAWGSAVDAVCEDKAMLSEETVSEGDCSSWICA